MWSKTLPARFPVKAHRCRTGSVLRFCVVCIVTLSRWLCKRFLQGWQLKVCGAINKEIAKIDEFKKYAFGKAIRVKYMNVYVSKNWIQTLISIYVNHSSKSEQQEFILSSENEMLVISLRDALLAKKKGNPRPQPLTVFRYEDGVYNRFV